MKAYETAGEADHPDGVRSESPQSLVTSHQNEYRLLIKTAAIHKLNRVVLPIQRSPASCTSPSSGSNGSPMMVCMAEKTMTGNAVAYLRALRSERRGVGVEPV